MTGCADPLLVANHRVKMSSDGKLYIGYAIGMINKPILTYHLKSLMIYASRVSIMKPSSLENFVGKMHRFRQYVGGYVTHTQMMNILHTF